MVFILKPITQINHEENIRPTKIEGYFTKYLTTVLKTVKGKPKIRRC